MIKEIACVVAFTMFSLSINAQQRVNANGEPYAEDILNNVWKWPASPEVPATKPDLTGFAADRLGKVPKAGVHPRILFSPDQIPDIRTRIENTNAGKLLLENLHKRTSIFEKESNWEYKTFNQLANGEWEEAKKTLDTKPKANGSEGHYQPYFIYEMMLKSFDCLIFDKKEEGKKVANAFYNYVKIKRPVYDSLIKGSAYPEDAWRAGTKEVMAYQFIAYLYDFTYNNLTIEQRDYIRELLAKYTYGRITLGMKIPPHFRNWNWIMVAQSFVLNAIAIEGEKGYDPRVYKKSSEVVQSYLSYAISSNGMSTEAVGYTAFGFYWGCPAMIAMSRRGDVYLAHPHFKAMKNWWVGTMQPYAYKWESHGDGGDGGPSVEQVGMMKYYYPKDSLVDYLWQCKVNEKGDKSLLEKMNIIVPLICATDPNKDANGKTIDYQNGAKLNLPLTFYDSTRGSIDTRSSWNKDAVFFEMEARQDGIAASHEHADRGNFDFSALGRGWSVDGFRGVESKYHNVILINGKGQGYFATPAKWLKTIDLPEATFGICDTKYAYDWRWPKPIETSAIDDPKFKTSRYKSYLPSVERFHSLYKNQNFEKDPSPNVVAHYQPYLYGNPLQWDEDGWPVRIPYNPVQRSFRTAGLVKGKHPYSLIVDDIQKNNEQNLYEWNMMLEWDLSIISIDGNDVILGKDKGEKPDDDNRFRGASRKQENGEPLLLVRIIECNHPDSLHFDENPSPHLEVFEKINTQFFKDRTFGLDKRLIIPSLSVAPNFKILLYPFRGGDKLPITSLHEDKEGTKIFTITTDDKTVNDVVIFKMGAAGRSEMSYKKDGKVVF
ncbi:hypothetical protein [Parasediminibacterium sp. JCM 36343]|uniref:hypothetical protein n=1 Tax=Parasediminibacterium sp. JCM 36343 TaxID=3374279 RepID=UPI0039798A6A